MNHPTRATIIVLAAAALFAGPAHGATGVAAGAIPANLAALLWAPLVAVVGVLCVALVGLILFQERPPPSKPEIVHRQFRPSMVAPRTAPAANDAGQRTQVA